MGQYHCVVNITRRERIEPLRCGDLNKQTQSLAKDAVLPHLLYWLLCYPASRGGGDFPESTNKGRWFGDAIAVVGDYAEPGDDPRFNAETAQEEYRDITDEVAPEFCAMAGIEWKPFP